jgi:biofilm PGA synthesis N-glycosyltransferase PgaC
MLIFMFWLSLATVFYTYIGYAFIVWLWATFARKSKEDVSGSFEPHVTLVIPAYNEADILAEKIHNSQALNYPKDKLQLMFITDGSTDYSSQVLSNYPEVQHLHVSERAGKSMAENRAIKHVTTPYVIFSDCNTLLNTEAVRHLVSHYEDPQVGAVSGEKKVINDGTTSGSGEGLYWKYESFLKKCDSDIYSLMGAAGELVSFRTDLFKPLERDTILDDFVQSMRVVNSGYRVIYEPEAYAVELPSFSLKEEMERKVRICAGGWQAMSRLLPLLNPLRNPIVTFLYFSHRVLRWSLAPVLLILLLPLNIALVTKDNLYVVLMIAQLSFYTLAGIGWWQAVKGRLAGPLLLPFYFTLMNVAVFQGFRRFIRNAQPAAWDKAQRVTR